MSKRAATSASTSRIAPDVSGFSGSRSARFFGRIEQAEDFDAFCVKEATIETRRRRLLVATDGEVTQMQTPLVYRMRPRALRVMVPQTTDAAP